MIGLLHFGLGRFLIHRGREQAAVVVPWLLALLAGAVAGALQSWVFGISLLFGLLAGVGFALMLVPISTATLVSDLQRRNESRKT